MNGGEGGRFRRRVASWDAWDLDRFPWEHDVEEMEDVREQQLRPLFAAATLRSRIAGLQAQEREDLHRQHRELQMRDAETLDGIEARGLDGDDEERHRTLMDAAESEAARRRGKPAALPRIRAASRDGAGPGQSSTASTNTEGLDVCHWYARLEDGVYGLWASLAPMPSSPSGSSYQNALPPALPTRAPGGGPRVGKRLPRVVDVREPWQDLARLRAILHICVVRRRGGGGGGMSVIDVKLARVLGELIFTLQRSHRARLHVLQMLASADKDRGLLRRVALCFVQSVLHPLAISETALLEWLAHLLVATSSGELGKGTMWTVLAALASREDCGLGASVGPEACRQESLAWFPSDWVLHAPPTIRRVAQLVAASSAETGITPEHFLIEGWLVPRLVAFGRDDDAAAVSREGLPAGVVRSILKTKVPAPDQCERGELAGLVTLRGDEVAALAHVAILVRQRDAAAESGAAEQQSALESRSHAQAWSPISRLHRCADQLRAMDFGTVKASEWYAIPLQDFRAHRLARCDADKVAWVCLRIGALQNLTMRVEETLAREALLRDGNAALHTRCLEMASIVEELESSRGEASMIWEFVDQMRSCSAYLNRLRTAMSSEETSPSPDAVRDRPTSPGQESDKTNSSEGFADAGPDRAEENPNQVQENDDDDEYTVDKAILSMKEPCSMLEIVHRDGESMPPRACVYEVSEDEAHVCISSDVDFDVQESFPLSAVERVEMGLSEISSQSSGLGAEEASLGCCFYLELQDGVTLQLVAPTEVQALSWTFGLQQLATVSVAETLSPHQYRSLLHEFERRRHQLD